MNEKIKVKEWIDQYKIVAIVRGVRPEQIVETAVALYNGGIRTLEITFNQASDTCIQDTQKSIALVKEHFGDKMCVGAGTVMTVEQAEAAKTGGADFGLAPNINIEVIKRMEKIGMVSIPGAMTPTEIATAYEAGAAIVKLFPAGNLGVEYVKAIQGPINHIPLMAVGGVNLDNINTFLDNGFMSVGIGSNIVKNALIENGEFEKIQDLAKSYTDCIAK